LQQIRIEAEPHRQKLTTHFHGQDKRTTFTPDCVTLRTEGGRLLQSRAKPRSSFSSQVLNSPWDELHVAYFNSYALWTYLTAPFFTRFPVLKRRSCRRGTKMERSGGLCARAFQTESRVMVPNRFHTSGRMAC
jgi:hypothetical protein